MDKEGKNTHFFGNLSKRLSYFKTKSVVVNIESFGEFHKPVPAIVQIFVSDFEEDVLKDLLEKTDSKVVFSP